MIRNDLIELFSGGNSSYTEGGNLKKEDFEKKKQASDQEEKQDSRTNEGNTLSTK